MFQRSDCSTLCLSLGLACSGPGLATPIGLLDQDGGYVDATSALISGVVIEFLGQPTLAQGTPVGQPPGALIDKNYTAQVVGFGNAAEKHETYVERPGFLEKMFSSAYADGGGTLEVGVSGFVNGEGRALSRWQATIKNYRSRWVDFDFSFVIPAGILWTIDSQIKPWNHPLAPYAFVAGSVDYLLRSPAGQFGGTYDDTQGNLYYALAAIEGSGAQKCYTLDPVFIADPSLCTGQRVNYTDNLFPYLGVFDVQTVGAQPRWGFDIDEIDKTISLPSIPPYGELTIYYDLFAMVTARREDGGRASLGDPFSFNEARGPLLVERAAAAPLAEPPVLALLVAMAGLAGLARRRAMHRQRSRRTVPQVFCGA